MSLSFPGKKQRHHQSCQIACACHVIDYNLIIICLISLYVFLLLLKMQTQQLMKKDDYK